MLGEQATPEQIRDLRTALGLDEPLVTQYARFLGHALRGDFGMSIRAQRPALEVVLERLPATLLLAAGAFVFALFVGMPIGVISAVKRLSLWDHGSMALALLGQSMPVFWLGLMLIVVFSVNLRWFPVSGWGGPQHLVLPAITLGHVPDRAHRPPDPLQHARRARPGLRPYGAGQGLAEPVVITHRASGTR